MKIGEKTKLHVEAFSGCELNVYKVFLRLFYNTKPITNFQNLQLITLLHEEKVKKKIKNPKVKAGRFGGNFAGGCEIS